MVFSDTQTNVVNLVEGEEFIVRQVISDKHEDNILDEASHHLHFSCAAQSVFSYCKFRSSAGEKCSFHNNNSNNNYRHGAIFEEFCDELKNRTVFSGSSKVCSTLLLTFS